MVTSRRGFSLKTFFAAGRPDGLQLFEHTQWIGKGLIVPRHEFSRHRARPELSGTGIYILCGNNPDTGCQRVYVSQISTLRDDIDSIETKVFWDRMIVFAADGPRLHRAHTDYIEARLIEIAGERKASELDNNSRPKVPALSEPEEEDAEFFIDQILLVTPTLGLNAFSAAPSKARSAESYRLNKNGAVGSGFHAGGRFVVTAGATSPRAEHDSIPGHVSDLRKSLVERGVLLEDGKQLKVNQDYAFETPRVAAMVLTAMSSSDDAWKVGTVGKTSPGRDAGDANGAPNVVVKPIKQAAGVGEGDG